MGGYVLGAIAALVLIFVVGRIVVASRRRRLALPRSVAIAATTAPESVDAPPIRIEACPDPAPVSRALAAAATQRDEEPRLRYPLVLVHGFLGFDVIQVGRTRVEYFRGIAAGLRAHGIAAHSIRIPPVARIGVRARQLARGLGRIEAERVNLVAHSMGGLDARYAIAELGLARRVASLTTVGTPHRGTPLADLGAALLRKQPALFRHLCSLGIDLRALQEMAAEGSLLFNRAIPDQRGVYYVCVVGALSGPRATHPLLVPSYLALARSAGENDGLVPAASQHWGELLREIDADHWAQIGWSSRFDAGGLFNDVARDLADRGF